MNYHVLTGSADGNSYEVVFHIPIPAVNNRVGVSYRTALANSGIGGSTRLAEGEEAGQITTAEKAQIESGELLEVVERFETRPSETAAQIRGRMDARYSALVASTHTELAGRLAYFGFQRNVT